MSQMVSLLISSAFINVRDFDVAGNGTTDDGPAIQDIIDESPVGATIYFPEGTYVTGQTIQLLGDRSYIGSFRTASVIKAANGSNLHAVVADLGWLGNTASYVSQPVRIAHLGIDGNRANQTSGDRYGIALFNFWSRIEDCSVVECANDGVLLSVARQDGTKALNTAVENAVLRTDIRGVGGHGIHGFDPSPTSPRATDSFITECRIETADGNGVWIEGAAGWAVSNNHIYGAKRSGIKLDRAFASLVEGNYIEPIGTSPVAGWYSSIFLEYASSDVPSIVANNRGSVSADGTNASSHLSAIYVYATNGASSYLSVSGNAFRGAAHTTGSKGLVLEAQGSTATLEVATAGNYFNGFDVNEVSYANGGTLVWTTP